MQISEAKQKLDEIIKVLSESKLSEIIDFANVTTQVAPPWSHH